MEQVLDEKELMVRIKRAMDTKRLLYSPEGPFFIMIEDLENYDFVVNELLPKIEDLRTRQVVCLRSKGLCWKLIEREVNRSRWQLRKIYKKGIEMMLKIKGNN